METKEVFTHESLTQFDDEDKQLIKNNANPAPASSNDTVHILKDHWLYGNIIGNIGSVVGIAIALCLLGPCGVWTLAATVAATYFIFVGVGHLISFLFKYYKKDAFPGFPNVITAEDGKKFFEDKKAPYREPKVVSVLYGVSFAIIALPLALLLGGWGWLLVPGLALLATVIFGYLCAWHKNWFLAKNSYEKVNENPIWAKNASAPSGISGAAFGSLFGNMLAVLIGLSTPTVLIVTAVSALLFWALWAYIGHRHSTGKAVIPFLGAKIENATKWENTLKWNTKERVSSIIFGLASIKMASECIPAVLKMFAVSAKIAVIATTVLSFFAFFIGYKLGHYFVSKLMGKDNNTKYYKAGDIRLCISITSVGLSLVLFKLSLAVSATIAPLIGATVLGTVATASIFVALPVALLMLITCIGCKMLKKHAFQKEEHNKLSPKQIRSLSNTEIISQQQTQY